MQLDTEKMRIERKKEAEGIYPLLLFLKLLFFIYQREWIYSNH